MQYLRSSTSRVQRLAEYFPAVVVTGARQTGKTTLLKGLFPNHTYVSLDLPSIAEAASRDPQSFLTQYPPPVIIDEVQYAPELFRHLKVVIDDDREACGQFILTGSQKFTLMRAVTESLAGRAGLMELEGLSCEEIGKPINNFLKLHGPAALLARGFFPQLWRELSFPSFEFYQSYLSTYLERDVRQVLNVTSIRDFERFMRACALRSGQILNKSELAKDVGIHHKTANDWLSVLQASNQIAILEPFFNNETKRLVKSPKLYFTDTGLLCALLGLREDTVSSYANLGAIWETFVYAELRRRKENYGLAFSSWFYRDQKVLEVDFVVESAAKLHLIEAKWSQLPDAKAVAPMRQLQATLAQVSSQWVVCRAETGYPLGDARVTNGFLAADWMAALS